VTFIQLSAFIAFLGFLLWALFVQDPYPYFGPLLGDWLHIPSFFIFTLLSYLLLKSHFSFKSIIYGSIVFSVLLEVLQPVFQPIRNFEIYDILLNFIGVFIAYVLLQVVRKKSKNLDVDDEF